MKRLLHKAFLALLLSAAVQPARGQHYPFFNLGIEQGLLQSQPTSLLQDRFGQLWIGTLGGLTCYDGSQFRNFSIREGLPSNTIKSLCLGAEGNICIGTTQGLSVYDGHSFRNYRFASNENPGGNTVLQLTQGNKYTLWCLAGDKIYRFREGKTAWLRGPRESMRWTALKASGPTLWAAALGSDFLFRYQAGVWDSLALPQGKHTFIFRIESNDKGQLILLSTHGAWLQTGGGWLPLYERKIAQDPLPYCSAQAADGSTWLGTNHGALRVQNGQIEHFEKENGFSDVTVNDLLRDRENNLWFAANGEGLYRFSGAAFTSVDERMGLKGTLVGAIAQTPDGSTFFGSFDGGLNRYEKGKVSTIAFPKSSNVSGISCLQYRQGVLWIGTYRTGLWRYTLQTGTLRRLNAPGLMPTLSMITQDSSALWLSDGFSVFRLEQDSLRPLQLPAPVESFALVGKDSLLLSVPDGLMLYAQGKTFPFRTKSGADSAQVVCMTSTATTYWIGTADNGIYGINRSSGTFVHFDKANGLHSDFIYNLYAAADGSIWAGTGYGINHITTPFQQPHIFFYGRNEGLVGMESNRNAVYPLPDGRIWFGTTGGAQLFNPQNSIAQTLPVSLQLESVSLFGEPLTDTNLFQGRTAFFQVPQHLCLPYKKNSLSFSFTAISLSGNTDISYRYRLKGLNAPWSDWSNTNKVTFPALPSGSYELWVECSTDGIHPLPTRLKYPFIIITPFYKTTLFRVLIVLACMLLGFLLQFLVALARKKQKEALEQVRRSEQAIIRQRTAEDFHDEVGNKLTRINVLTNVLRSKTGNNPEAIRVIDQIQDSAKQLYGGTRDILWSLQPSNDNLFQVLNRIRDLGRDLFGDTDTAFAMDELPADWKEIPLSLDQSRNLIMIFKEALNNALKYAQANQLCIRCRLQGPLLEAHIQDDGQGFDPATCKPGQGLANMKTRAQRLEGYLEIQSRPESGTSLFLSVRVVR